MSDGPHKSLPMRPFWRKFSEYASKEVYSLEDLCAALPAAIISEFKEAPLQAVSDVLTDLGRDSLLGDDRTQRLIGLQSLCRGSSAGVELIAGGVEAVSNGHHGSKAVVEALASALKQGTANAFRGIEEHWRREGSAKSNVFMRARLAQVVAATDFRSMASKMLSQDSKQVRAPRIVKQMGLDDGPVMP